MLVVVVNNLDDRRKAEGEARPFSWAAAQKEVVERSFFLSMPQHLTPSIGRSNQESKFDFVTTHQCVVKIDEAQQKITFCGQSDEAIFACSLSTYLRTTLMK